MRDFLGVRKHFMQESKRTFNEREFLCTLFLMFEH